MSKEIYISSTPHETRLAIVENDALTEIYYERENEYTLAGSIYNGRVTRVLPGMQSSFVDIGLERDAFLYITDFMEEAGEGADFEGSGNGEARAPRGEGQRRDRGDRGERPATIEGTLVTASPEEGAARSERSERNERNDRGDRSGRGDRNDRNGRGRRGRGDRDRSPVADTPHPVEAAYVAPAAPVAPVDGSDLGEGAPGADGSRRWRGRRGRRRGRGAPGEGAASPIGTGAETAAKLPEDSFYSDEEFTDYPLEIDGAAEAAAPVQAETFEAPAVRNAAPESGNGGNVGNVEGRDESRRRDGGRGGRNDRNGRSDRGGRGDRGGREDRPARVPRGFAPSSDRYSVGAADESEGGAPAEPIILPGESLSKYRPAAEGAGAVSNAETSPISAPAGVILPKPQTVVDETVLASGWDGGFVLPGESLSRRRGAESRPETRDARRSAPQRDARREVRGQVSADPQVPYIVEDAVGVSVVSVPESQPEIAQAAHPEWVPEAHILHERVADPTVGFVAETVAPAEDETVARAPEVEIEVEQAEVATTPEIEVEYEPGEASASYRVDPVAPSEFRQSAPVLEAEPEAVAEPIADAQPEAPMFDTTGVPPPPMASAVYEVQEVHAEVDAEVPHEAQTGEITSLQASGEMHTVQTPEAAPAIAEWEGEAESVEREARPAVTFAPGDGALEEEILEDEMLDAPSLQAGYDEEFEDLEEETLEGAADLGTMLREMSIDQITAPGNAEETGLDLDLDEDEEFEEEEAEEDEFAEDFDESEEEEESEKPVHTSPEDAEFFATTFREPGRETASEPGVRSDADTQRRGRRDGRRDRGRGGERDRGGERERGGDRNRDRGRSTGGEHERSRSGNGGGRRQSAQATNLPAISDLLKPGQEILVQIAKEPIAKKGARITSHIALPGRFLVFMPTVNHTGVSRKIESDGERRRLKEILLSEKGEAAGGFIVRTAASGASEEELRSDLRFLLNLWADIKQRSESSKSPALIYHDLNLVERILRDQVTDTFSAIWVDTETDYERILRFLQRFQPSLIRRVKLYTKETPLFEQFGITEEINKALRSKVWLKSGGSIVINQTEALVAIDINTGKYVGKTARLEDTIVKTNLDAIPEIVRQIRLRDLGGIIIIDFIDMDERKNRNRVMAALEDELKTDRAPSKVLQFNDFGLVAITRKRVKQSLERTLSTTCGVCQGTGMVKSPITVCNDIYIEMRKMHKHLDRGDVMLRVHPDVIKQLKSGTSKWLQEMEEMVGKTILIKSDPSLHPEQFDIH
jgi:ribonuclease E